MWKYVTKDMNKEFLLSLKLLDNISDNDYIRKIYSISNTVEKNYKVFKIKKNTGGFRTIYAPSDTLKHIQRQILEMVLEEKCISKYACAYKKGISLRDNALDHVGKKIILKLDIKDFFQSINFVSVYNSCFSLEYFPESVGILLTYLVTYKDYLPQGAPTSAYISNLVMKTFDEELGKYCESLNISYTRYSDDMTFSGNFNPGDIIRKVRKMLYKVGMELNDEKTHVIKSSRRQCVTGIVVNEKVQVNSDYRKKIRQEIYYIKKFGLNSHMCELGIDDKYEYVNNLHGRILFVLQVNCNDSEFIQYRDFVKSFM